MAMVAEHSVDMGPPSSNHFKRTQAACVSCRASKTRCIHDRTSHDSCVRCQRFGLHCSYPTSSKKRGRPSKSSQAVSQNTQQFIPQELRNGQSFPSPPPDDWTSRHMNVSSTPFNVFDTSIPDTNNTHRGSITEQPMSNGHHRPSNASAQFNPGRSEPTTGSALTSPSNTTSPTHEADRNLNSSEYLDPNDRSSQLHPPKVPFFLCQPSPDRPDDGDDASASTPSSMNVSGQDPISSGMLSEAEAQSLVEQFHDHFNQNVAVLDRKMHTLSYMRQHTVVLLSAVLAATSKLFRKDLCPGLLAHANTISDRASSRGVTHISSMQSLMILTYTKAPADTSAWRRIGMAIRMGYQMHSHVPRNTPLPDDENAARVILNAERTWYCSFCFDRGLSHVFGLPYTIRSTEIGNVEAWAREHVHFGPSVDMHLAASIDSCRLKDQWRAIFDSQPPSPSYCESAIENLKVEAEALYTKWFGKGSQPIGFQAESEHVIAWCLSDFMLTSKRQHYESGPHLPMRLDACLSVASQIVDEIEISGKTAVLGIMQDTASCMTSSLGIFFHKVFMTATITQKSLMISLLQRVLASHVAVINGDEKSAPAHVARCIKRISGAIRADSRSGSPSFNQSATEADMSLQESFGQFDDTIGPIEGLQYTTGDEQFWQMLFSA